MRPDMLQYYRNIIARSAGGIIGMAGRNVILNRESFFEINGGLGSALKYSEDLACLAQTVQIGPKTAPNRLVCQAMEGCDGKADGSPDELTERRYLRFARGGAGIIWFEATACLEEGRANPRQLWLTEENIDAYRALLDRIRETALRENGTVPLIVMQNTHSGRYSKPHGVPEPIIAYSNPIFEGNHPIDPARIITDEGIDRVKAALVKNSELAERAGFDGVDVKCCHRYLNSELLSAYQREGRYGGSFENRTRLLREAVEGSIQRTAASFLVSTRLNVYDGFPYPFGFGVRTDGTTDFDRTEPVRLLRELNALGVDLVNVTMGNPYFNPHVNRPFSAGPYLPAEHPAEGVARMLGGIAAIKAEVPQVRLICSALSWLGTAAPNVAAGYIRDGGFDFAGFGRMIFAYPDFARAILRDGALDPKKVCVACSKCTELMRSPGGTPGCVIRDPLYTDLYRKMKADQA